jgi:hypothetical protein
MYRELTMILVKEILLRLSRGESKKAIHRSLKVHRRTIGKYYRLAVACGVDPVAGGPEAITDELIGRMRAMEAAEEQVTADSIWGMLIPLKPRIEACLGQGLRGSKILQLLRRESTDVPSTTFYRFLNAECPAWISKKITVALPATEPGDYAQCDFGRLGKIYDPETKRERTVYAFIITLCYSRHQYVHVSFQEGLRTLIEGCEAAFAYFGGVMRRLIVDNMKVAVKRCDRYDPLTNPIFLEYAQHRNFVVDPAVVGKATHKAQVERAVPYVRDNFFAGESFVDLEDVQSRAVDWCTHTAGVRLHHSTRQKPLELFEAVERDRLQGFDAVRYDIPRWAECKVHRDHLVRFCNADYSVPTPFIGRTVQVRGDSALVRIFFRDEQIKLHNRVGEGERSIDPNDFPEHLRTYTIRDPGYHIEEARKRSADIGAFVEKLLSGPYP